MNSGGMFILKVLCQCGYVPDTTDHTLLTFHSKRILMRGNGRLEVIGDL